MMNGATAYAGSVSRAVELAIEAGNDIVESSTTPRASEAFWSNNLSRMATSPRFRERVAQSATRVIKAKLDYFKGPSHVPIIPDVEKIPSLVPDPEGAAFFLSQAVRSVTLIDGTLEPLTGDGEGMLIASSFPSFLAEGKKIDTRGLQTAAVNNSLWGGIADATPSWFCLSAADQLSLTSGKCRRGKAPRYSFPPFSSHTAFRDARQASDLSALSPITGYSP
jgi:beta-N-acetylhexosaminidase